MGRWAVERLIEEATLAGGLKSSAPARQPRQVKMDCPLVERDSVGSPAPRRA